MTHEEIAAAVVDVMQEQMALALAPVLTRLAVAETNVAHVVSQTHAMGELRDRVVVVETKSAMPAAVTIPMHNIGEIPDPVDLSPVLERLAALETNVAHQTTQTGALGELRDRLVVVETKSAILPAVPEPLEVPPPVDLSPMIQRLSSVEATLAIVTELRDRVVVVETKSALVPAPVAPIVLPAPVSVEPLMTRLDKTEREIISLWSAAEQVIARDKSAIERVVALETKTAQPVPPAPVVDLSEIHTKLATVDVELKFKAAEVASLVTTITDHSKDLSALRERVAVVESKPPVAGPKGDPGEPGQNGQHGAPGLAGLSYEGVYQEGKTYELGNLVTWGGSSWHCNEETTTKPGEGLKAWTLMVKRGRDGRDGRDAINPVPVVSVAKR